MQTTNSWKENQDSRHQDPDSEYKLMIKEGNDAKHQGSPQENPKEYDWLSDQFNRAPFLLYKYWLVLNFAITLVFEFIVIRVYWNSFVKMAMGNQILERMATSLAIDFMFFLYGCCEMLFAMSKRSSKIAQQSVVKFQYNVIGSVMSLVLLKPTFRTISKEDNSWLICVYGIFSAIIHLIGGLAVLRVFKRNHPLARPINYQTVSEDISQDFLQQNGVIGSEIAKYDGQLNRWPFFIYKWWLKFVVVFEIWLIFSFILSDIVIILATPRTGLPKDFAFLIELWILSVLNAYSCFEAEVAARTKSLIKSKRALFLIKVGSFLSIITCLFATVDISLDGALSDEDISPGSLYLFWFLCLAVLPILTLIGAIKVNKIIEQRDQFAKISNYTNDSYL